MEKVSRKMILFNEKVRFEGAGITVEVRSRDRGKLNDGTAHAHVFDSAGKKQLAEVVLNQEPPQKSSDVVWYRQKKKPVPDGLAQAVVDFAKLPDTFLKRAGINGTNWRSMLAEWMRFHGE
jgi:hypothetical protein